MTTLAGLKIKRFRFAQSPKLSREAFGARFGAAYGTVQGWEEEGKVPRRDTMNALTAAGVVDHADWYRPALCGRCDRAVDDLTTRDCTRSDCPLAERRAA